ncbi:MAG: hypothetical protein IPP22_08425 [Nitrosomonas sp.]|nr:hypothetical protein [Nitrosomonas sp.]
MLLLTNLDVIGNNVANVNTVGINNPRHNLLMFFSFVGWVRFV